jgi:glycogen(starch) synthase
MSELKVLLLGWEFNPDTLEDVQKTTCYTLAKALGERVNLSMILPVADPDFILQQVHLAGLNNIDLPAIEPAGPKKGIQPFAEGAHIRADIPLYGAPVHDAGIAGVSQEEKSGQAVAAGVLHKNQYDSDLAKQVENLNVFSQQDLSQMPLDAQIIQYARWATRLAAHRQFDVIYAYDWRTFLAGTELKLVCDKPLVLQVDSLSMDRQEPNNQGWMYQVEAQALHKADGFIVASDNLAANLAEKYHISRNAIKSLEEEKAGAVLHKHAEYFMAVGIHTFGSRDNSGLERKISDVAIQQENGVETADIIRDILRKVAA